MFHSRVFAGMIACFSLMYVDSAPLSMKPRKINTVSKPNVNNVNLNCTNGNLNCTNENLNCTNRNKSNVNNTESNMSKNMSNFTFFFDEITLHDEIRMINKCDKYTNTSCKFCQGLVNLIDNEFQKYNKTIYDITSMIKDICQLIHAPVVTQECVGIMNSIEKILNMAKAGNNSSEICHSLHYC